jgi:hypothetical protein
MTPAQKEALETADRIVARAKSGVTKHRLIHAEEELPLIQAYALVIETLAMMAENAAADHARITEGMNPT